MSQISIFELAHYFHLSLDEIPQDLRKAIEEETTLKNWDSLPFGHRIIAAQSIERKNEESITDNLAFNLVEINDWLDEKIADAAKHYQDIRRQSLNDVKDHLEEIDFFNHTQTIKKTPQSENQERKSILKIIKALAQNGYKHPARGSLKEMVDDFQRNDNGVDEKTLKKYLDEANML